MCEFDISAGNFTIIDWDIHNLWLNGYNQSDAVQYLKDFKKSAFRRDFPSGVSHELLTADVGDYYRLFAMIETAILTNQQKIIGQNHQLGCFQFVDENTKHRLIEAYYSLDGPLCRELLGKKLSTRLRKDLDEISEKTNLQLKSCRRQFDNIKRVFKVIEEMPGGYVKNIENQFGLGRPAAEKYATLVFASSFRLEMSKRKLYFVTFDDVMAICLMMMEQWMETDEAGEPALNKEFITGLRDLKMIQDRDKEHKSLVCQRLTLSRLDAKFCQEIETHFKALSRNILSIAICLSSPKELKDFFVILVEKILESFKLISALNRYDLDSFLRAYTETITENMFSLDNDVKISFKMYMALIRPAILTLFK